MWNAWLQCRVFQRMIIMIDTKREAKEINNYFKDAGMAHLVVAHSPNEIEVMRQTFPKLKGLLDFWFRISISDQEWLSSLSLTERKRSLQAHFREGIRLDDPEYVWSKLIQELDTEEGSRFLEKAFSGGTQ